MPGTRAILKRRCFTRACEVSAPAGHFPVVRSPEPASAADVDAFSALFRRLSPRVFGYALRHVGPQHAEDVVADTFLVAWRRRADLPPDPLPWLLVVARKTIGNLRRGDRRRTRLVDALGDFARATPPWPPADEAAVARATTLAALDELSPVEREAVLLVAWDGLRPHDAARVAGCSPRAFEVRLSRARARLARSFASADAESAQPDDDRVAVLFDESARKGV